MDKQMDKEEALFILKINKLPLAKRTPTYLKEIYKKSASYMYSKLNGLADVGFLIKHKSKSTTTYTPYPEVIEEALRIINYADYNDDEIKKGE